MPRYNCKIKGAEKMRPGIDFTLNSEFGVQIGQTLTIPVKFRNRKNLEMTIYPSFRVDGIDNWAFPHESWQGKGGEGTTFFVGPTQGIVLTPLARNKKGLLRLKKLIRETRDKLHKTLR